MPENSLQPAAETTSKRPLWAAYAVEGGLGVVAAIAAWLTGVPLADEIGMSLAATGWGAVATLPMLAALAVLTRLDWPPINRIREIVRSFTRQLLWGASWGEVALLCLLAGIGEELLFRGVVQVLIADATGQIAGIVLGGVLFGAVHYLTTTYFVLGVAVGCYLGWLFAATGSLVVPIVAHAAYDFVALAVVLRGIARDAEERGREHATCGRTERSESRPQ
jgi:membrane protease YdiL (CAAX protease family)